MSQHLTLDQLEGKALSFWQKFTYSFGNVGTNLAPGLVMNWLVFFYIGRRVSEGSDEKIFLVSAFTIAALNFMGRIVDSLADPLVGYFSDRWQTRWGRRIPWVVIGAPFLAFFTAMVFFPPNSSGDPSLATFMFRMGLTETIWMVDFSSNAIWLGVGLTGLWFFYTAVVAPYLSLLPEITPYDNERVTVSTYMAYADVVGMLLVSLVLGVLIEKVFANGLTIGPIVLADGYKVSAILIAIFMLFCFWFSVIAVREKKSTDIKPVTINFFTAAKECTKNPSFWPYIKTVSFLRLGIDVLVGIIPFMVVGMMKYGEAIAGALQGIIIIIAAFFFPLTAHYANKYGKKKVFKVALIWFAIQIPLLALTYHFPFVGYMISGVAGIFGVTMTFEAIMLAHCIGLFVLLFFPVSAAIVLPRPIYCDVMDMDEQITGLRREAMYNGMEGFITKFAAGLAGAAVPLLVTYGGDTQTSPWGVLSAGPICGFFFVLAWISFKKHPIDK